MFYGVTDEFYEYYKDRIQALIDKTENNQFLYYRYVDRNHVTSELFECDELTIIFDDEGV